VNLARPTPIFVKLTHLRSLGSVTIVTYIRLPCLVQIRITSVVINNKGSTAIPHSVPVKDVAVFKDQSKFSPIIYPMRRPRRSFSSLYRQPIFQHLPASQCRPRLETRPP